MKSIARFILCKILGWKLENDFPKELKKYVVIAAPHTSWLDFPIAILSRVASGTMIHFIGKSSLFSFPFGVVFRALGGIPVNREKSSHLVDTVIAVFNSRDQFVLALSPEGTRKKVKKWKTGFYYIAKGANVPIVMATLDFGQKKIKISKPHYITSDIDKDFDTFHAFFEGVRGKKPELF
ncbi:MAG: 1-acyl-sn-glycerol-3-phosphate acyltransferase [Polaribacter sp.]|nr:1-acyl-sn-glycerol-3-phosphate acyltransferase [Polaribacter sp.]